MDLSALPVTHKTVIPRGLHRPHGAHERDVVHPSLRQGHGGIFQQFGLNREYFQANQAGTFALKQLFTYLVEVREGEEVTIRTRVLGRSAKKLHVMHFMTKGEPEVLASTNEFLAAHVDMKIRRTSPFPPSIAAAIDRLVAEHAALGLEGPRLRSHGALTVRPNHRKETL